MCSQKCIMLTSTMVILLYNFVLQGNAAQYLAAIMLHGFYFWLCCKNAIQVGQVYPEHKRAHIVCL